jgi:hypothetical protein
VTPGEHLAPSEGLRPPNVTPHEHVTAAEG